MPPKLPMDDIARHQARIGDAGWWTDEDFDDYGREGDWDEWEEAINLCHMRRDGQCGAAGSEYCDFDCPVMRERREAGR